MRSASVSSVSTISTGVSRSPSPYPNRRASPPETRVRDNTSRSVSRSPPRKLNSRGRSITPPRQARSDLDRKRRRSSVSSVGSYSTNDDARGSRERTSSRNIRRRYEERSPVGRGRSTESKSPYRSNTSQDGRGPARNTQRQQNNRPTPRDGQRSEVKGPPRQRSLSPFSKRLALTQAMNG